MKISMRFDNKLYLIELYQGVHIPLLYVVFVRVCEIYILVTLDRQNRL